ncbi:MAG: FlgD immunoglobulin-like domain containing protein [Candidatus Latescibacteria bacterium]|nr:FlgD immunoglobulin-like domain containing protein [Candidatus Latescibacterota bacterium]
MLAAAVLLLPLATNAADLTSHWNSATGGAWETAANWSPVGVPNNGANRYAAVLDRPGPITALITSTVTIDSLYVDAEDEVQVGNYYRLQVSSSQGRRGIENRGVIRLNSLSSWTYFTVQDGPVRLTGGGELIGGGTTSLYNILNGTGGGSLVNVDNTIRGAMNLGYDTIAMDNQGSIIADNPLHRMLLDPSSGGMTNSGLIRAENGAVMELNTGNYDNTGGVFEAVDDGTVKLSGTTTLTGGTLQTSTGGEFLVNSSAARFIDLTSLGRVRVGNGYSLVLEGTIANQDTLHLESTSTWSYLNTDNGPVTLTGGGVVNGHGGSRYAIIYSTDSSRLINQDNTIRGAMYVGNGQIGITNHGTLLADHPVWPMMIDPSADGLINTSLMRAENGAVMELYAGDYNNTGGVIEAVDGATVKLLGTTAITGGTLRTSTGGEFQVNTYGARFMDLTSLGCVRVGNGYSLVLEGTIANQDTIHLDSTSTWSYLNTANGPVTLTGGGVVDGYGGSRYAIIYSSDSSRLINQDNTIRGAMYVGNGQIGITNHGTLLADHALWPMILDVNGDGFLNTGTVSVTGAAGLQILAGPFTQQGVFEVASGTRADHDDDFIQTAGTTTIDGTLDMGYGDSVELQGGVFGGEGLVVGDFHNTGGTVSPGGAPGTLTIDGDYTQSLDGTLAIDIDGTTPGSGYDVLEITGDAVVAGEVSLNFLAGYTLAVDDTFVVLTADSVVGELTIAPGGEFAPGIMPWVAVRGNDVVVTIEQISITGVEDPEDVLPLVRPLTVSPNPSPGGQVTIDYALADKSANETVAIYDIAGRRVSTLSSGLKNGSGQLHWNGRSDDGRPVAAGIYFVRLQARGGYEEVKRVTVVR